MNSEQVVRSNPDAEGWGRFAQHQAATAASFDAKEREQSLMEAKAAQGGNAYREGERVMIDRINLTIEPGESEPAEGDKRLSIFLEISNVLSTSRNSEELMDHAICKILEHFPFHAGSICLLDESGQFHGPGAARGIGANALEAVKLNGGLSGMAARTKSLVARCPSDSDNKSSAQLIRSLGFEFIICVPLTAADKVMGVMNLAAEKSVSLDQGTMELLLAVGNQIAIALKQAKLFQEMTQKIETLKFFANSAAHDMKSPAIAIKGFASRLESLYRETLDARGLGYCDRILKASDQVLRLVDGVNAYIAFGEAPLHMENFHLGDILDDIEREYIEILRERRVNLVAPQVLPLIYGDRFSIARALRNMVDNALKYGGNHLSMIQIGHRYQGNFDILFVYDDGAPIKKEDAHMIFNAFERLETSRDKQGSGLGLAIVKAIAERHGGAAWVTGGSEGGPTVCMSISRDLAPRA